MDIGVFQGDNRHGNAVEIAQHAENLGFESYWAPDHTIMPAEYSYPIIGFLAMCGRIPANS